MFLIYLHYINPLFRALDLPLDRLPPRVPDPPAHAQLLGALLGVLTKKHAWNQGNVKMYIEQYSEKWSYKLVREHWRDKSEKKSPKQVIFRCKYDFTEEYVYIAGFAYIGKRR
jgi:hypothetical protein